LAGFKESADFASLIRKTHDSLNVTQFMGYQAGGIFFVGRMDKSEP
jgi:hypothetical protein